MLMLMLHAKYLSTVVIKSIQISNRLYILLYQTINRL